MDWKEDSPITYSPKEVGSNRWRTGLQWQLLTLQPFLFLLLPPSQCSGVTSCTFSKYGQSPSPRHTLQCPWRPVKKVEGAESVWCDFQARPGSDPQQPDDMSCSPCVLARPEKALAPSHFHCPPAPCQGCWCNEVSFLCFLLSLQGEYFGNHRYFFCEMGIRTYSHR